MEHYQIIRSRRRTVAFGMNPAEGVLLVRAPMNMSDAEIRRLVETHADTAERFRRRCEAELAKKRELHFCEGGEFYYLGELYPIRRSSRVLAFDRAFFLPGNNPEEMRLLLEELYIREASVRIVGRARMLAERFGIVVGSVRINRAKGRWGSCSGRGTLNFSWRLLQWPESVIDYVICHELAHRKEMNHSVRFWAEVGRLCPDYRTARQFMKKNVALYEGW